METHHDLVEVNGTRLYYETAGAGKAVVLIHGFALDTRMWDDQFLMLARRFRVIRYDLRGFGRSALPKEETYSHCDDLEALLDRLGIHHAFLVGLSKGGSVALDFALMHASRVDAMVLIDPVLGGFQSSKDISRWNSSIWDTAREHGIPAAKEAWMRHPLFTQTLHQPDVADRLEQMVDGYSGWHFLNTNPELSLKPPAALRLSALGMPVLAIVGEHDIPDIRKIVELIGEEVPQAKTMVVPGAGHMSNMEAPEVVTQSISAFLATVRDGGDLA